MFSEISRAAADAIKAHQHSFVTGVLGILGTGFGLVVSFAIERWKQRGKVTFTPMAMIFSFEGRVDGEHNQPPTVGTARQIRFDFELRALNSYPNPKSLPLISVEFFANKLPRSDKSRSLLSDPFLSMGTSFTDQEHREVVLPAHSFTRLFMRGAGVTDTENPADRVDAMRTARAVRIRFLVAPHKTLDLWHVMTAEELKILRRESADGPVRVTEI